MNRVSKFSVLFFSVFILQVCAFGQKTVHTTFPDMPIDENTKLVTYKKVVQMKGTPSELYDRALAWANKHYKNPGAVIKKADKSSGVVECYSNIPIYTLAKDGVTPVSAGYVYYTLSIEAKENRYRYTITDIYKKEQAQFPIEKWFETSRPEWTPARYDHLHQIDEAVKKLMGEIEKGMQPEKIIRDDW